MAYPEARRLSWQSRLAHPAWTARAMRSAAEADCLIAVGSSLQVHPIAAVVPGAKDAGASLIIVNAQPTPFDGIADVTLGDSISAALPILVA